MYRMTLYFAMQSVQVIRFSSDTDELEKQIFIKKTVKVDQ